MADLIRREDVFKAILDITAYDTVDDVEIHCDASVADSEGWLGGIRDALRTVEYVLSAEQEEFEWCHDCKEYDQTQHCCHRWTKVIRETVERMQSEWRTTGVIEHDASITDTDGNKYLRTEYLCGACKKKVLGGDDYCSHCGCKLEWKQ